MIELTPAQWQALHSEEPPRFIDPTTNEHYVLVRADVYERMQQLLGETVYTTADMLDRTMAEDDATDPHLAELQKKHADEL